MNLKYYILFSVLICMHRGVTAEVPETVAAGFKEYAEHGPGAAWATWTKDSLLHDNETMKADFMKMSTAATTNLGKSLGEELILSRDVSPSIRILYFTWKFERGPLFLRFNCYRTGNRWIVTWIQSSDWLENLLPSEKPLIDQKHE